MKPLFLLGEAYGENEAKINAAFCGAAGLELLRMLNEAGVLTLTRDDYDFMRKYYDLGDPSMVDMIWRMHPECYRSNVINQRPLGNKIEAFCGPRMEGLATYPPLTKSKYLHHRFSIELERLGDELLSIDPNLVVALGGTALWALTGHYTISKYRGTTMTSTLTAAGFKVLPTYHPAAVLYQWPIRPTTIADLMKAEREQWFPEVRRPERHIWIEPALDDIRRFYEEHVRGCTILSVDIETSGNQVTCIGLAPRRDLAIVIPFVDKRRKGRNAWTSAEDEVAAWRIIRGILEDRNIPKVFQNGLYDIAFLLRSVGVGVRGAEHDTMLLHHALQPEAQKSLGYMGSVYCDEGAWKVMRKTDTIKADE